MYVWFRDMETVKTFLRWIISKNQVFKAIGKTPVCCLPFVHFSNYKSQTTMKELIIRK